MNIKFLIPTFCCLFIFSVSFAQRQNVYFLKNSGEIVKTADSSDFTRIVSEPDAGSELYNVKEYYKNGKPRMLGKSSTIDPIKLEEGCLSLYPNGKKKQFANYKAGQMIGDVYNYFPNGQVYNYIKYLPVDATKTENDKTYQILACNDSTGKELVVDGNGHYVGYDDQFKFITEEGEVKAGFKDGKWKGATYSDSSGVRKKTGTLTDNYNDGHFISGELTDKDNKVFTYTIKQKEPNYKGGINAFNKYLANNIEYPYEARKNNITGIVLVQFVVNKDGSLTDIKAIRSPNDELTAEALRVVKKSPKWEAGILNGSAVRVLYTIPINFTMHAAF